MYRISETLRGEQARSDHWFYERTISNKVDRRNLTKTYIGLEYYYTDVATYVIPTKQIELGPRPNIHLQLPSVIEK